MHRVPLGDANIRLDVEWDMPQCILIQYFTINIWFKSKIWKQPVKTCAAQNVLVSSYINNSYRERLDGDQWVFYYLWAGWLFYSLHLYNQISTYLLSNQKVKMTIYVCSTFVSFDYYNDIKTQYLIFVSLQFV